jgi:porphobilinogen deaminase
MILSPDGRECFESMRQGSPQEAVRLAVDAAEELLARAPANFLSTLP